LRREGKKANGCQRNRAKCLRKSFQKGPAEGLRVGKTGEGRKKEQREAPPGTVDENQKKKKTSSTNRKNNGACSSIPGNE